LLKLKGDIENPFPLLLRPLYVMPSVTSQVLTLMVPTSIFWAMVSIADKVLLDVKIEQVIPYIDEFIFYIQEDAESTIEIKQIGSINSSFW